MSRRNYWIGFNHVAGVGPVRLKALREHFPSLDAAWHAPADQLRRGGLDQRTIQNLLEARTSLDLPALAHQIDELGAAVLTLDDPDYPPLLKELPDAPPLLYSHGSLTTADNWAVAIVGTRKASAYGRDMAYQLAADLAHEGITVVSGLALGIDAAAHRGALDAGGRTLAILPCGSDVVYPPEHRALARQIANQGALLTQFPPGTQAEAKNFPPRNLIISGLSLGVIVVEAPAKSGALITADFATEHGREVFAVPGPPTARTSQGTNRLIQDGAKLVMSIDDVLNELNLTREASTTRAAVAELAPANAEEARLIEQLGPEPRHIDELVRATGLPIATVSSTLSLMELKGMVRQVGSMQYTLGQGHAAPYQFE